MINHMNNANETYLMNIFNMNSEVNLKYLIDSEHPFIKILDAIDVAVLITDEDLMICYVNPAHGRIWGMKSEDVIGKNVGDIWSGALLPEVIQSGKSILGVYRSLKGRECISDITPIKIKEKIIGGVSLSRDITEFKRISNELQQSIGKTKFLTNIISRAYEAKYYFRSIIGESQEMQAVLKVAMKAAKGFSNIVITGESGTGKEMFAQAIHNSSVQSNAPFVAVNCAAIAVSLVESELFGYEEGSFTGAKKGGKIGLFEIADGGTIFLDEITELGLDVQAKLLRVLQERTIRRVGASKETPFNARVIAATNCELKKIVDEGKFREDLYYRLNVINIQVPPLRRRGIDIILLAQAFLQEHAQKYEQLYTLDEETIQILQKYNWPGNIRELRNAIEYSTNVCEEGRILPHHLPDWLQYTGENKKMHSLNNMLKEFEKQTLITYMNKYGDNLSAKKRIAKELGISLATLYNKLKLLGF